MTRAFLFPVNKKKTNYNKQLRQPKKNRRKETIKRKWKLCDGRVPVNKKNEKTPSSLNSNTNNNNKKNCIVLFFFFSSYFHSPRKRRFSGVPIVCAPKDTCKYMYMYIYAHEYKLGLVKLQTETTGRRAFVELCSTLSSFFPPLILA